LNNYVSNVSNIDNYWSVTSRLDYTISPSQKLFGHYVISKRVQPGKNSFFPGASGQTLTLKNYAEALDYVNTLTPTTVLNLRFSYTRFTTVTSLTSPTTSTDLGVNANAIAGANPKAAGFPQVKITGYATLATPTPATRRTTFRWRWHPSPSPSADTICGLARNGATTRPTRPT
jgi:hypothetical protein